MLFLESPANIDIDIGYNDSPIECVNLLTLKAKLCARGIIYSPGIAHADLCWAFEKLPVTSDKFDSAVSKDLDVQLQIAQQWILYAGNQIYESPEEFPAWNFLESHLWKGKAAYNKGRWAFWKERARLYSGVTQLSKKTRDAAKQIVVAMERIEKDN